MKILIIGNIGAGKTTLAKKLKSKFKFKTCLIDDMRRTYGDGTVQGEYLALYHFLQECSNSENVILEFTGAGCHKYAVRKALEEAKVKIFVIFLDIAVNTCKKRIGARKWDVPIPAWGVELEKHLNFIQNENRSDFKHNFWVESKDFSLIRIDVLDGIEYDRLSRCIKHEMEGHTIRESET